MSLHHHKLLRQRDGYLPVSGSVVESDPTPTGSLLAQNTVAVVGPSLAQHGPPLATSPVPDSPTTTSQSSTPTTTSATSSASSGHQISLGTTIGACVAAVIALLLAVLLAFYCSRRQKQAIAYTKSRNVANDESRIRSHLEPWKRMNDNTDRWEGQEQAVTQVTQRPLSGPIGAMFQRSISNSSGEKSSEHNRDSVGTMRHFTKYHSALAAEMASQSNVTGTSAKVTKPPPVLHLVGRGSDVTPPISWDGETVGAESFMSLHSAVSSSPSPFMAMERSTPPATSSSLHHWESAEVVQVGQTDSVVSENGELPNPFADSTSSVRSSIRGENPFFSGRGHSVRRTLLADTHKNPFSDPHPPLDSAAAIQSLIAALQEPTELGNDRIVSVQSSLYSGITTGDGDSAISVTAFPHPPTQLNVR
ncbi:hypothetical protein L210DRAFT_3539858 [Boletus edulis BED1]|uniref:Uncharacterized protein n=1 Tax=Boletus edulis BED1 TaxID=1328754 RepID=A0AAD4BV95_BOLED|nr:hypothetical protein L210DRAFT_3539858 [Boletus edulis BED1]